MEENTHHTPNDEIHFSEFSDVRSKCAQTITLSQFVSTLQSDRFRQTVEDYRRLRTLPGHEAEAQALKNRMPCIIPAAICMGGHAVTHLQQHSRLLCIDLDHCGTRTEEIKQLLRQLPWIIALFTSISGEGVKALILVRIEDLEAGWAPLYAAAGEAISRQVKHPYDAQCKSLTQPCFYSWDPDAYYNPQAYEFEMPKDFKAAPARKEGIHTTPLPAGNSTPDARLLSFLRRFSQQNAFARGSRNEVCLKMGRELRCNFFSQEEKDNAVLLYANRFAENDFTEKDIRERVSAGYQFIKRSDETRQTPAEGPQGSRFTLDPKNETSEAESPEDVSEKNNKLRAGMPCLPDELYAQLPDFLQQCCRHATSPRERDITLLGSIVSCSALFPFVSFFYKDRMYSPHLYLSLVGPSGTSKGTLGLTTALLDPTDEHYARLRAEQMKKYEEEILDWEQQTKKSKREKAPATRTPKPEKPRMQYFRVSPNTSRSRLIESLAAAADIGCIMASTEIVTLSNAIGQDYGAYDDILLKAAHHEQVDSSFRIDGEPITARHPHLALLLSGTQEQFAGLYRSLESGLYSRFSFYTCAKETEWKSCAPGAESVDLHQHFRTLGDTLLQMHLALLQSPTCVNFSPAQWEEHTRTFSRLLQQADAEGRDSASGIIFRCGLQAMRIAATLTVFRKWDDYRYAKEYLCCDNDFHTAMQIALTLLQHSFLLSTSLPESKCAPAPMHRYFRLPALLEELPDRFLFSDFVNKACEQDISLSTAKRMLKKAIEQKVLEKEDNAYIKLPNEPLSGSI